MLRRLDEDGSGDISKDELMGVLRDPDALEVLDELQVDVRYLLELQEMLYTEEDSVLTIPQIIHLILESRGERIVTIQDLIHSQSFMLWNVNRSLEKHHRKMREFTQNCLHQVQHELGIL